MTGADGWLRLGREIATRHAGRAQVEVLGSTSAHAVLLVRGGATRLVLKVAAASARPGLDYARSAAAQRLADHAGVPVAGVVAAGADPELPAVQYLLHEHVDGVQWRAVRPALDPVGRAAASTDIARAVLALQSVRPASYGVLGGPPTASLLDALGDRITARIPPGRQRVLAQDVLARHASLFDGPVGRPTLTHDDLHHANLLFRRRTDGSWRLVAVLDWDKAWAGPAESDVARMGFWDDMTDPVFWSVYREAVPERDGWAQRAAVYQLLWCLEYDVDTDRHRRDTAELVERLT
ncbi:phosphotransferase family protein [Cellulomonas xylanilytica]|uniref:Aminoglycoside phosphotransferase domain-containing protein n=1 Tax=Cellulomonas xylanilytica TaxID=233583 RepID=A0A510V583_9CELL|nr:phosphotransferase [Cellulomonas xylanilytica]GEK21081.1 hypothetical protein CXY01_16010 [Cellulomonas xylanilytica]